MISLMDIISTYNTAINPKQTIFRLSIIVTDAVTAPKTCIKNSVKLTVKSYTLRSPDSQVSENTWAVSTLPLSDTT